MSVHVHCAMMCVATDVENCGNSDALGAYHRNGDDCYYIRDSSEEVTWFEARQLCASLGLLYIILFLLYN